MGDGISLHFWGARGSVPTPGPATAEYGGNTACLELRLPGGRRLVFDAGTGIRLLGKEMMAGTGSEVIDLFLTHYHWDHIQGLPFFAPLHCASRTIRIHGPAQDGLGLQEVLGSQMSPIFFPQPLESLGATLELRHVEEGSCGGAEVEITAMRVRHPTRTFGYRLRAGGVSVVYVPDDELGPDVYDDHPEGWLSAMRAFVQDADLLVHDATWLESEYRARRGWGHSTVGQAIALAERAGVRALALFHHAPDRSDREPDQVLADARRELAARGAVLRLEAAREGAELTVTAAPPAG